MTDSSNELHLFLGRVEGKLDAVISSQAGLSQRMSSQDAVLTSHAERIVTLETQKSSAKHVVALTISIFAVIASLFDHLTTGFLH